MLCVEQRMDDCEPGERTYLDHLHGSLRGRARTERSYVSFDPEAREDLDKAQKWFLVCERDAPVRNREAEGRAPPARLVAEGAVAECHPGEVANAIVVIELLDDDRHVAEPAPGG